MSIRTRSLGRACLLLAAFFVPWPSPAAEPVPQGQVRVTVPVGNVRQAPKTQSPVVFQVGAGQVLRLIETAGDWLLVESATGARGYILGRLVQVEAAAQAVPNAPLAPAPQTSAAPASPSSPMAGSRISIQHEEVGCVLADQHPRIDACLQPAAGVGRAQLHFRAGEKDPWYAVDLKPAGTCYTALLPKPTVAIDGFEYYVFALDRSFGEVERPDGAPGKSYHVRVVRKARDCQRGLGRLAAAVTSAVAPIVVSVARNAAGVLLAPSAAQVIESGAVLAGFSAAGVIIASTGAAPAVAAAAVGGASAAGGAAGGGAAAGTGGGVSNTVLIAGGAAVAGGAAIAVATKGSSTPACSTQQMITTVNASTVAGMPFRWTAPDGNTVCLDVTGAGAYGRCTALCAKGVCSGGNCSEYWVRSDGAQLPCLTFSCSANTTPDLSGAAVTCAQNAISFCGM